MSAPETDPAAVPGRALDGRIALVTGASRGIGEAIARRFAAEGAAVAVAARTVDEGDHPLPGSVSTTVRSISDAGGSAVAVTADLAKPDDRQRLIEQVTRELGPIDVLVNNAAVTYFEPVLDFSRRHYDLMFEVQVRAPFQLAQAVIPGMAERGEGWILNISSAAGRHPQGPPYRRGMRGGTVYGMCKAALERFTTGLAAEVYADGIAVNVLAPTGLVGTPGIEHHGLDRGVPKELIESTDEFAGAALWLCSGPPSERTGRIDYSRQLQAEIAGRAGGGGGG
ncbi:MAG TPA: SDR family NAD(P)-dependent oxidoreductase [Acidimicrobiales bacterium]|nr:SDR family NAD(P)-dependent oxidoreductase [Acidimicrobiales bacterium]